MDTDSYLHVSVVDEGPSPRSLQHVVQEVLQPPVEGVPFGGFLSSGDAAALPSRPLLPTWTQVSGVTGEAQAAKD